MTYDADVCDFNLLTTIQFIGAARCPTSHFPQQGTVINSV